jgi:hypothetical protein
MPRVPPYQTTPFTIDPSARSTQTFAERYGVSPPHSPQDIYGNSDYGKNERKFQAMAAATVIKKDDNGEKLRENKTNFLPNSTTSFDVELLPVSTIKNKINSNFVSYEIFMLAHNMSYRRHMICVCLF